MANEVGHRRGGEGRVARCAENGIYVKPLFDESGSFRFDVAANHATIHFGMELHAARRLAESNDGVGLERRPRDDLGADGQLDERVDVRRVDAEAVRSTLEQRIVLETAHLDGPDLASVGVLSNLPAERLTYQLVAEADAEQWNFGLH